MSSFNVLNLVCLESMDACATKQQELDRDSEIFNSNLTDDSDLSNDECNELEESHPQINYKVSITLIVRTPGVEMIQLTFFRP